MENGGGGGGGLAGIRAGFREKELALSSASGGMRGARGGRGSLAFS